MVDKIFGHKNFGPLGQIQRTDKNPGVKKADNTKPTDRVDFSSALQNAAKAQAAGAAQDTARIEKLEALKSQIQSGNYQPDLNKVASSLLPFLLREG